MDDAYDKWFNEERDKGAEWGDVLRSAYDAGLKRGLAADKFDPYEDDYDPKRAELLTLAGQIACERVSHPKYEWVSDREQFAKSTVNVARAIIATVDVSLEGSDHLLTKRGQGERAGRIISAWADQYLVE
jgi:hypothetical protein